MVDKSTQPEDINDLNRFIAQAQSVAVALIVEDNYDTINGEILGSLIWLLGDRLDDIKRVSDILFKQVEPGATIHESAPTSSRHDWAD